MKSTHRIGFNIILMLLVVPIGFGLKPGLAKPVDSLTLKDINAVDKNGQTQLMRDCFYTSDSEDYCNPNAVHRDIMAGSDVNVRDNEGETALTKTCRLVSHEDDAVAIAEDLIIHGAKRDLVNSSGKTAALTAHANHLSRLERYLNTLKGPKITALSNSSVDWRLIYAISDQKFARARQEIINGANVNARDMEDKTPLILLAENSNPDFPLDAQDKLAPLKFLLSHGADVNLRSMEQRTALMEYAWWDNEDAEKLLMAHGAKIDARDATGATALIQACNEPRGDYPVVQSRVALLLISHKAKLNVRDIRGDTALMCLARSGQFAADSKNSVKIARALVAHGANSALKNNAGHTALGIARDNHFTLLAKLLETQARSGVNH